MVRRETSLNSFKPLEVTQDYCEVSVTGQGKRCLGSRRPGSGHARKAEKEAGSPLLLPRCPVAQTCRGLPKQIDDGVSLAQK